MYDVYYIKKTDALNSAAIGVTRGQAKLVVDSLMAVKPEERPLAVVYRCGKFAYSRRF